MQKSYKILQKPLTALLLPLTAGIIISLLSGYSFFSSIFTQFEFAVRDLRSQFRAISLGRTFEDAVILDIDNRSIYKLGKMSGWPRDYFAQVVEYLDQGGAGALIFDIIFDRSSDASADSLFASKAADAENVFFALSFSEADSLNFLYAMESEPADFNPQRFYYHKPEAGKRDFWTKPRLDNDFFDLMNRAAGVGFVNSSPDRDGRIRAAELMLDFNGHLYPSLAFAVLLKAMRIEQDGIGLSQQGNLQLTGIDGSQYEIPLDKEGRFLIDYLGTFQTIRYISFYDVLEKRLPAEFFDGKIVFIGTSAPGLSDLKSVPVQRNFPGVEIHANIIADILRGWFIRDINPIYALMILFLICLLASSAGLYLKTWQSISVLVVVSTGYILGSFHLFATKGVYTQMVVPAGGLFLSYLGAVIYKYIIEERDKRFIKHAFSHFVDNEVIKEILEDPARLKLGGERRELTVLFSDIRDFTSISEKMRPEELSAFLNVHLTEMTNIVFRYGGLLDKYIGDAVVALFGVPVARGDHALRGARAALAMVKAVKRIRQQFSGTPMEDLRIGVGVNSGIASVGNMGSDYRFEYTAIGDEMNLGSRLEDLNKFYGTSIIISGSTAKMLGDSFIIRELDFVQVKGKSEPVGIYQLIDPEDGFPEELIEIYRRGLVAYCAKDWHKAEREFKAVLKQYPSDEPAKLMLQRVEFLRRNPPADDWPGVRIFDNK